MQDTVKELEKEKVATGNMLPAFLRRLNTLHLSHTPLRCHIMQCLARKEICTPARQLFRDAHCSQGYFSYNGLFILNAR